MITAHRINRTFDDVLASRRDADPAQVAAIVSRRLGISPDKVVLGLAEIAAECDGSIPWRYSEGKA